MNLGARLLYVLALLMGVWAAYLLVKQFELLYSGDLDRMAQANASDFAAIVLLAVLAACAAVAARVVSRRQ